MSRDIESTSTLLLKIQEGDFQAKEILFRALLPKITNWAHGRLPYYARDLSDTSDIVQKSLINALENVNDFEALREGAFLAYLRQITLNNIRMEIRRVSRRQQHGQTESNSELIDMEESILQKMIGDEAIKKYEKGLMMLKQKAREAVILRIEFGYTFSEIAMATAMKSSNSARMLVSRSLANMAKNM